jgi:hypothetical protein
VGTGRGREAGESGRNRGGLYFVGSRTTTLYIIFEQTDLLGKILLVKYNIIR